MQEYLPLLACCLIYMKRLPYARDLLVEAVSLWEMVDQNPSLYNVISTYPELLSQRDVELANKNIQEYQSNNNVKMESSTLM
jgi:hypothetical protein